MSDLDNVEETITEPKTIVHEEDPEDLEDKLKSETGIPEWAVLPANLKIPVGRTVYYMKFKSQWTNAAHKGDRHCVLWGLSDNEENTAIERSGNKPTRYIKESAKLMIRAIDGHKADWTRSGKEGDINLFWDEIGAKCRQQITNMYLKTHSLQGEDMMDFLGNCVSVSTALPL